MENSEMKRYTAIEITSKAVKIVHGFVFNDLVHVLYAGESAVESMSAGKIIPSDALNAAVKSVIGACGEALNIRIKEVILVLPPYGLAYAIQQRTTNIIANDNKINQIDIDNVLSLLRKISFNEASIEIVDVVPFKYVLDSQEITTEPPIGKYSQNLSVHAALYAVDRDLNQVAQKAIQDAGVKVKRAIIAPVACALYFKNYEQIPSNYMILNFGAKNTTLTVIENHTMIANNGCMAKGSDNITEAIANKFGISMKDAKMLKETYGLSTEPGFKCNVYSKDGVNITVKDISETIIQAISPILEMMRKKIAMWNSKGSMQIVLTGGGAKLYGFSQLIENAFGLTCIDIIPYSFGARNQSYQNLLGAIKYADIYIPRREEDSMIKVSVDRVGVSRNKDKSQTATYRIQDEL